MNSTNNIKEITIDGVSYVCPTWEQMGNFTFLLAKKILESESQFDRIVALAKGGWTWARTLADYLQITNLSSTRLKSYDDINQSSNIKVLQPLSDSIDGEKILIFDDVIDSGKTVAKAKEYMTILGCQEISVASLCFKPHSSFTPDYYAFSTKAWIIFPHEYREFIIQSQRRWSLVKVPIREIKSRLIKIGLPSDQVDYFLQK